MLAYPTLTAALMARRTAEQGITYIKNDGRRQVVSYGALYTRALGILHILQRQQLVPGDECLLYLSDNEQFIDAFWACLFGKIVPVPLAVGSGDGHRFRLLSILQALRQPFLYTTQKHLARLRRFAEQYGVQAELARLLARSMVVESIDDISRPGQEHPAQPDDIAFLQFSSGSTGEPKGITLTHANLLTNIRAMVQRARLTAADSTLSWMPLTHDMGIVGFHLVPLVQNLRQYLLPPELFVRRPQLWLQIASEVRATLLASPNFGYQHYLRQFDATTTPALDLSCVRLMFNGAEPIAAALCERFTATLRDYGLSPTAMYPVYGLAEATLAVAFPEPGRALHVVSVDRRSLTPGDSVAFIAADAPHAVPLIGVGQPLQDCQVRIVADDHTPLAANQVGHIHIRGGNVTRGYYHQADAASAHGATFTADGWLDTGDLGFVSAGELYIAGRRKDVIIVYGENYHAHDVEAMISRAGIVEAGKVAVCGVRTAPAVTDDIVAFVVFRGPLEDFAAIAAALRQCLGEQTGLVVQHVVPVSSIPKTTSGKAQRYLLAQRYVQGDFDETLAVLDKLGMAAAGGEAGPVSQIERWLTEQCAAVLPDQHVDRHTNIFDIGTSSLKLAQLHERIEEQYPGRLDITDFFDYPTITNLAAHLVARLESC